MFAIIAGMCITQKTFILRIATRFVQINAKRQHVGNQVLTMLKKYARFAGRDTQRISIPRQNTARYIGVVSVEEDGTEAVYNLEVSHNNDFVINGGVVVHNCMDATRYFVKTMRIAVPKSEYHSILMG